MRPFFIVLIASLLAATAGAQQSSVDIAGDCGALQITGTFSEFHFDEQKKGLVGAEIRIVATEDGYEAALQFADGRLSNLFIGEVEFNVDLKYWPLGVPLPEGEPEDGDSVRIVIPNGPYAGTLDGKVTKTHLQGILRLVSGDRMSLHIPRAKGYWD